MSGAGAARRRVRAGARALAAALLCAGCQQLIGIEPLHEQSRPGTADAPDAALPQSPGGPPSDGGSQGGEPPAELPCSGAAPGSDCVTSLGAAGLCSAAGGCVEYCVLDQSLIDQCLLL